jgi:hypothetical protein
MLTNCFGDDNSNQPLDSVAPDASRQARLVLPKGKEKDNLKATSIKELKRKA